MFILSMWPKMNGQFNQSSGLGPYWTVLPPNLLFWSFNVYLYGFIIKPNRITSPLPVCFNFMWINTLCSEKGHVYSKFSSSPGIHDIELHGYRWCFLLYCQDLYIVFAIGPDVEAVLWPVTSVLYNFLKFVVIHCYQWLLLLKKYEYYSSHEQMQTVLYQHV